jgi:hypothetical protein
MPTKTGSEWIRNLYRPGALERGYRILAREMDKRLADADVFALASRCEAAGKRFDVASDALEAAEFAKPRDEAAADEAYRLQGIANIEFRDAALPLIWARATNPAGVLAKARALKIVLPDKGWVERIEEALQVEGVWDPDATLYSLTRDLIALAGEGA